MSLINEALRKARQEAVREQAQRRGLTAPALAWSNRPLGRHRPFLTVAAVATLLVAAAVAAALFLGVRRPSESPVDVVAGNTSSSVGQSLRTKSSPAVSSTLTPTETAPPPASSVPAAHSERPPVPSPDSRIATNTAAAPASGPKPAAAARHPAAAAPPERPGVAANGTDVQVADVPARETTAAPSAAAQPRSEPGPPRMEPEPTGAGENATPSYRREADLTGFGTYRLDGIAWSADRPFALLNGQVVGPGGFVDGAHVVEVEPDKVLLAVDERRFVLRLR